MEPIISGTTTERIVRTTLLAVLFSVGSALFFRDGLWKYPRENMEVTIKALGVPVPDPPPVISKQINAESAALAKSGDLVRDALAKYAAAPFAGTTDDGETVHILFGPGGHLRIRSRALIVSSVDWVPGPKHERSSLIVQLGIGVLTGVVALVALIHLVRVLSTSISLNEEGLKIRGKPLIPWDAMKGIDANRYEKTGWLRLEYELSGRPGRVRLDNYWHKAFRPIVEAICERKGFDYKLPPPRRGGGAERT
jgi:hypothetical protein